jgi:hypothetical protein
MTIEHLLGCLEAAVTGILSIIFAFETFRRSRLRLRGTRRTGELVELRTRRAEDGELLYYPVVAFTLDAAPTESDQPRSVVAGVLRARAVKVGFLALEGGDGALRLRA